jgi:putative DNA methylase
MRKGHINAIKTWWARRPVLSARGIIFASLVSGASSVSTTTLFEELINSIHPDEKTITMAKELIQTENEGKTIALLDPFGGGGSIPFEAARLGLHPTVIELNPIAHLLEKAILEYPQQFPNLAKKVEFWGKQVLEACKLELSPLFNESMKPNMEPIVYFWTRKVICPYCSRKTPIIRHNYLVKKTGRYVTIDFVSQNAEKKTWQISRSSSPPRSTQQPRGSFECKSCNKIVRTKEIKQKKITYDLQAICLKPEKTIGKQYFSSAELKYTPVSAKQIEDQIDQVTEQLGNPLPRIALQQLSGIINPPIYGYKYVDQLFTKRQHLVLLVLIKHIRLAHERMISSGMEKHEADSILVYLSAFVEHLVDWNSTLTMWIPQNEQAGRSLAGPGLPMRWEFMEIHPFASGPANLYGKLQRIINSLSAIPTFDTVPGVIHGDATNMDLPDASFDIIVTDPPYYDSIFYSALSDLFTPWFTLLFHNLSDSFNAAISPGSEILPSKDSSSVEKQKFQVLLTRAMLEMNRVLRKKGKLVLMYAHRTIDAWGSLAESLVDAKFTITHLIPITMERQARPRSMKSSALSTVIVFWMEKRTDNRRDISKERLGHLTRSLFSEFPMEMGFDDAIIVVAHLLKIYSEYSQYEGKSLTFETLFSLVLHNSNPPASFEEQFLVRS